MDKGEKVIENHDYAAHTTYRIKWNICDTEVEQLDWIQLIS